MPDDQDPPPVRLILAALFHAARLVRLDPPQLLEELNEDRPQLIALSLADADELLRQAGPS